MFLWLSSFSRSTSSWTFSYSRLALSLSDVFSSICFTAISCPSLVSPHQTCNQKYPLSDTHIKSFTNIYGTTLYCGNIITNFNFCLRLYMKTWLDYFMKLLFCTLSVGHLQLQMPPFQGHCLSSTEWCLLH